MAEHFLSLREADIARTPAQRRILRGAIAAAVVLHALALAVLIWKPHTSPVRVTVARQGSISAYVNITPAPAATTGAAPRPVIKPRPVSLATAFKAAEPQPASNESTGAAQDVAAGAQGGGPVRMTTGQIQLLKKVDPIYPPLMVAAKRGGTVVVDATITPDGSIDDVMVLQSLGPLFDRAAIQAVKQWRYTPPGFEAVLTVTVIFTIR
jgi:periplasmic protein TonB